MLFASSMYSIAQLSTQTVRGTVIDNSSNIPLPYASVVMLNSNPLKSATADEAGNFTIHSVPLGRYDIKVSMVGYEPFIIREMVVSAAKETFLAVNLKESSTMLKDVVVRPNVNKEQSINQMTTVSARMLSVDEATRYAGGFDDPARLASSFAGVASNNGDNGISVRGNNPKFLQWKMEGVEIPNPNHFADLSTFGGGALTAMSSQLLANSDFLTGAFPAEYGNALSGVFDIFMRNGNNQKMENTFQVGIIGIDAASEGPFRKNGKSSYLFNYRYSTLGLVMPLMPKTTDGITYQDLSFKMNFPTKKAGVFSLWGIGLIDHSGAAEKTDSTKWFYDSDKENQDANQFMAAGGVTHKYLINNKMYLKSNLVASVNGVIFDIGRLDNAMTLTPLSQINNKSWNLVLSSFINTKFNARHTNKTGFVLTGLMYDVLLQKSLVQYTPLQTLVDENGFSSLISGYTNSSIDISRNLMLNIGVNSQLFTLNKHYTVEPRIGLKWKVGDLQSFGLACGLHSRLERINYYYTKDIAHNNNLYNKNLDFSKAHHWVMSYDRNISEHLHFKAETYYQMLYNIPVVADSSFSFINLQADWFFNHQLQNTGKGQNYGLDLSLEKYLSDGYYYMINASLFNSKYKGGDNVWRNTRYNRKYLLNFLIGKEWQVGAGRQNVLSANVRLSYQGGDWYSPVNITQSLLKKSVVYDETNAFSKQLSPSVLAHFTMSYKINKKNKAHEFALKMLNITQQKDFYGYKYNYKTNSIEENSKVIFIPNISYKIEF